jgi:hypothetical protein
MGMPVIHSGVQRLRGRVNCSPAGFEHNDLMPGSRKLNGCKNSNRAAADNDDVTRRQLRRRYLVKIEDHMSGNLRRRDRSQRCLRSAGTTRSLEPSGFRQWSWGRRIMRSGLHGINRRRIPDGSIFQSASNCRTTLLPPTLYYPLRSFFDTDGSESPAARQVPFQRGKDRIIYQSTGDGRGESWPDAQPCASSAG